MSNDFFGAEKKEKTGTVDDYFEDIPKYPGLQKLINPTEFREKHSEFANKLGEALSKLKEKEPKAKRDSSNSVEIDGHTYYWNMWNNEKQVNRIKPQSGGGGGSSKPMNAIIHQPLQISFATKDEVNTVLNEQSKGDNLYTRIIEATKDQEGKLVVIIEQYKLVKVPYESIPA